MTEPRIIRVAGAIAEARPLGDAALYELVEVGERRLLGEVIRLQDDVATIQVFEETSGLALEEPVRRTGSSLTTQLGPGLLGSILDGGLYDVDAVDPGIQSPIREDKRRDYYTGPVWGPVNAAAEGASTHLVYVEKTNRLYTYPEDIVLSGVDGGGSVSLAGELNLSTYDNPGRPLRWVGNDAAW